MLLKKSAMLLEKSAVRIVVRTGESFQVLGAGFLADTDIILT